LIAVSIDIDRDWIAVGCSVRLKATRHDTAAIRVGALPGHHEGTIGGTAHGRRELAAPRADREGAAVGRIRSKESSGQHVASGEVRERIPGDDIDTRIDKGDRWAVVVAVDTANLNLISHSRAVGGESAGEDIGLPHRLAIER